jgi:SM-20-related protein
MPQNPDKPEAPLIEVFENLAPPPLHAAAWATCVGAGWRFGHGSVSAGSSRFWYLELQENAAFDAIWEHSKARCETLAGGPLRVVQQYANGHTYGLGGNAHADDKRPGTFTLLYYPNPEWEDGWEGETVFYDEAGEVDLAVRLRPNRAVFFDSRIVHNGRAPNRWCGALRVTVAYKLERVDAASITPTPAETRPVVAAVEPASASAPSKSPAAGTLVETAAVHEIERDGARRMFAARVEEGGVRRAVEDRLRVLGESVRLPGFRQGKIPHAVLDQRYGAKARAEALKHLAADIVRRDLPAGNVASACDLVAGRDEGAMEIRIHAMHLPDLPSPHLEAIQLERLTMAGATPKEVEFLQLHLKEQVLDRLAAAYEIPLFPGVVDIEFAEIWRRAEEEDAIPSDLQERNAMAERMRAIAERRLRLALVLSELARRFGIEGAGAALEDATVDRLVAQANVRAREISREELRELMDE